MTHLLEADGQTLRFLFKMIVLQRVPPTHEHLGHGMELDSGSGNTMEMRPADAEWLIRNVQELYGESTRSNFLRNYT
jgi:hypothetical protein